MRLPNKTTIITGAGSGLGFAIASRLSSEGADSVLAEMDETSGRRAAECITKSGGKSCFIRMDARIENDIRNAVEFAVKRFGKIDILVNNAGIGLTKSFEDISAGEWDNLHAVNLRGYYLLIKYAAPHMAGRGGGSIINISSVQSLVPYEKFAAYAASKGGINSMTIALAREYGKRNIRVNAVCPGMILTPATEKILRDSGSYEKMKAGVLAQQCLPLTGEESDIAGLVLYLASDEARFITGQIISCDGGVSSGLPGPVI